MKPASKLLMVLCALALLAACGTPGAPQPPSLELARPSADLAAARKGSRVTLTWTPPAQTTDGTNIRAQYAGPTRICRAVSETLMATCVTTVGQTAPVIPPPKEKGQKHQPPLPRAEYVDTLPPALQQANPAAFAEYAVEVQNSRGRSAGLSNQVKVPLAPTLPPPEQVTATTTAEGIVLKWPSVTASALKGGSSQASAPAAITFAPRVYRREEASNVVIALPVNIAETSSGTDEIIDRTFEWEKTYSYWVTIVTAVEKSGKSIAEVEGDDSVTVTVFAHDVFPPAVPTGLEAVASGIGQRPFIDLTWVPDTDPDLAGYNVYRQQPDGTWVKLNSALITTPSFRDEQVVSGQSYTYAVSAVDVRGNESARSQPARESLP